jgi:glucosamine--fructose-6-phosphate aminotransferase (isomerizing)
MNLTNKKYADYALVQEMMGTIDTVRKFDPSVTKNIAETVKKTQRLYLTGEGSSRIFPAKNAMRKAKRWGMDINVQTDGSRQSYEYDLSKYTVCCASNSGRTKEVILLAKKLSESGKKDVFGLTACADTMIAKACASTHILNCGWEQAVAATKSVVEQALYYESILWNLQGVDKSAELKKLPELLEQALTLPIPADVINAVKQAETIYFSGYNDGVAEELTLKTNEITRRKSDFLEGTYAVHGIEEVMSPSDVVFVIDPIEEEIEKFHEVLQKGVGLKIVAIADHDTPFETIMVPAAGDFKPYVMLCAGWNLLVEIGITTGINLDKPERARKVGNELII